MNRDFISVYFLLTSATRRYAVFSLWLAWSDSFPILSCAHADALRDAVLFDIVDISHPFHANIHRVFPANAVVVHLQFALDNNVLGGEQSPGAVALVPDLHDVGFHFSLVVEFSGLLHGFRNVHPCPVRSKDNHDQTSLNFSGGIFYTALQKK